MMNILNKLLLASLFTGVGQIHASQEEAPQQVLANFPHTDIFLFTLSLDDNAAASISDGKNVTKRMGYDNQPTFTPNGDTFVFSRGDDYQTDIYEYNTATNEIKQLTDTAISEFSPTPIDDNSSLMFVSERNASVWQATRQTINEHKWFLAKSNNPEPIGYFAINDASQDFLYWSRYGFNLKLVNQETGVMHYVTGNAIPSRPYLIPQTNHFSFVHRQLNEQVWIKMLNPETKAITPLIPIYGTNFDYTWGPEQSLFIIQNDVLYQAMPFDMKPWQAIADLSDFGIASASRLAVNAQGTHMAIVGVAAN